MTPGFTVIRDTTPLTAIPKGTVVAMGNFDGVHLGHRAVIAAALQMGRAHGRPALAVTFEPHPRRVFSPNTHQFRLTHEAAKLTVLAGAGLGHTAANIRLDKNCGLKHGIYAVRVGRGQGKDQVRLDGVASFGRRPTFDNGAPLLEIFLFDFKSDLYGAVLDVAFIGFIREELKFDSVEMLVRQMDDDSTRARAALAAAPGAFPKLGTVGSSSPG